MKWLRTIDSAQRQIEVSAPKGPGSPPDRVVFHIQGVSIYRGNDHEEVSWLQMMEQGLAHKGEEPLSFFQRLLRREAKVGELDYSQDGQVSVTWWCSPDMILSFDLNRQEEADLWRECEIMALSAGFHFRNNAGVPGYKKGMLE